MMNYEKNIMKSKKILEIISKNNLIMNLFKKISKS